jgi:Tfp pilus assembly protein FimT
LTLDAFLYKLHRFSKRASIMRTTITIEDDAFAAARSYARARALKLGQAVSELIRRGSAEKLPIKQEKGVWVFDLPPDTPRVTARQVQQMLDESA